MKRRLTQLTIAASLVSAVPLLAQGPPYGGVKTFAGDVTLEAKAVFTPGWSGRGSRIEELKAIGPVRLTDDAMPDGAHMTWPMLAPAAMASNLAGMKQWRATVTFTVSDTAPKDNAHMGAQNIQCKFSGMMTGIVSLAAPAAGRMYVLNAHLGALKARCTGTNEDGQAVSEDREFEGPPAAVVQGTAPGQVNGTKQADQDDWKIKLVYNLAPVR